MDKTLATWIVMMLALAPLPGSAASFRALDGFASGVSADGSVIVGSHDGMAYRWTAADGYVLLGALPGGAIASSASGLSSDGNVVVGVSSDGEAYRWSSAEGMAGLGVSEASTAKVSADGAVVFVDQLASSFYGTRRVLRWTADDGAVYLPGQSTDLRDSYRIQVSSSDGSLAAGNFQTSIGGSSQNAFRWSASDGFVLLTEQPGGLSNTFVRDMTPDASILVGVGSTPLPSSGSDQAFRWTPTEGFVSLTSQSQYAESDAFGVSADGSIIVGSAYVDEDLLEGGAFIWDSRRGDRFLTSLLEDDYGLDLSGWDLYWAATVSADGRTIIGRGRSPAGVVQSWVAVIPEPGTGLLLGCGLIGVAARRRASAPATACSSSRRTHWPPSCARRSSSACSRNGSRTRPSRSS